MESGAKSSQTSSTSPIVEGKYGIQTKAICLSNIKWGKRKEEGRREMNDGGKKEHLKSCSRHGPPPLFLPNNSRKGAVGNDAILTLAGMKRTEGLPAEGGLGRKKWTKCRERTERKCPHVEASGRTRRPLQINVQPIFWPPLAAATASFLPSSFSSLQKHNIHQTHTHYIAH